MIVYVDMDDVLCNYSAAHDRERQSKPEVAFPQSQYGFFANLEPLLGAIESINKLRSYTGIDVYVLTAPSVENPLSYTEKRVWIEKYLGYGMAERLIICSNKGLLKGDLLIDDHIEGKGQADFEGVILHYGSDDYPDWNSVLEKVLSSKF